MSSLAKQFVWGISEKKDGNMKFVSGRKNAWKNRKKFFNKLDIDIKNTVSAGLVHGHIIKTVGKKNSGRIIRGADGLITNYKNLYLTITTADCLPLYFFDRKKKVIGVAHAGWRGILDNIAGLMIKTMMKKYTANPKDIIVSIGPHIRPCHFEIKADVYKRFNGWQDFVRRSGGKTFVNLVGIVKKQLLAEGVKKKNIIISHDCTYCLENEYFSYRREGSNTGFMLAYIGRR